MFVILILAPKSYAQSEDERGYLQALQEVFQTELVFPQSKGEVQLTFVPSFKDNDKEQTATLKTAIEYGITDNFQVGLEFDSFTNLNPTNDLSQRGIGDLELNTKYAFMNIGKKQLHIAGTFQVSFPTADIKKGLTEGFIEYQPFLLLAKSFPNIYNLQIFSQVGGRFNQRIKNNPINNASFTIRSHKKLKIASHFDHLITVIKNSKDVKLNDNTGNSRDEKDSDFILNLGAFILLKRTVLTSEFNFINGSIKESYFTPGIVWPLPKNFEIGIGVPIGLNKTADNVRVVFNFIYEFNILKR